MLLPFSYDVSIPVVQAIEDAILLGKTEGISDVLDVISQEENFPSDLAYGLEALFYFRKYYGCGGELEPQNRADKQTALVMDAAWGRQLLEATASFFYGCHRQIA